MSDPIVFDIIIGGKKIVFDSDTRGLFILGKEYESGEDGILVYDKVLSISEIEVKCQLSTNTSTLIPALRVLGISYNSYFDKRGVIESQNNITFYWQPSRLAAFYNRYSTDGVAFEKRESIIRNAVDFLTSDKNGTEDFLPEEYLHKLTEECQLLGFYDGFPIFDASAGLPQLQSRLGIHIGRESIMVSTPMDMYQNDVYELAQKIENTTKIKGFKKKNRVRFEKVPEILGILGIK